MALKADRHEETTDISFFYAGGTAARGGVACFDGASASGAAMDQGRNLCIYKAAASTDVPVGILLNDVVNKDLTRTHLNQYKDEVQKGGKVTLLTRGWVVTNMVSVTVAPGQPAFASSATAGYITNFTSNAALSGALAIGRWMSNKDADGYAKVAVNIPQVG